MLSPSLLFCSSSSFFLFFNLLQISSFLIPHTPISHPLPHLPSFTHTLILPLPLLYQTSPPLPPLYWVSERILQVSHKEPGRPADSSVSGLWSFKVTLHKDSSYFAMMNSVRGLCLARCLVNMHIRLPCIQVFTCIYIRVCPYNLRKTKGLIVI